MGSPPVQPSAVVPTSNPTLTKALKGVKGAGTALNAYSIVSGGTTQMANSNDASLAGKITDFSLGSVKQVDNFLVTKLGQNIGSKFGKLAGSFTGGVTVPVVGAVPGMAIGATTGSVAGGMTASTVYTNSWVDQNVNTMIDSTRPFVKQTVQTGINVAKPFVAPIIDKAAPIIDNAKKFLNWANPFKFKDLGMATHHIHTGNNRLQKLHMYPYVMKVSPRFFLLVDFPTPSTPSITEGTNDGALRARLGVFRRVPTANKTLRVQDSASLPNESTKLGTPPNFHQRIIFDIFNDTASNETSRAKRARILRYASCAAIIKMGNMSYNLEEPHCLSALSRFQTDNMGASCLQNHSRLLKFWENSNYSKSTLVKAFEKYRETSNHSLSNVCVEILDTNLQCRLSAFQIEQKYSSCLSYFEAQKRLKALHANPGRSSAGRKLLQHGAKLDERMRQSKTVSQTIVGGEIEPNAATVTENVAISKASAAAMASQASISEGVANYNADLNVGSNVAQRLKKRAELTSKTAELAAEVASIAGTLGLSSSMSLNAQDPPFLKTHLSTAPDTHPDTYRQSLTKMENDAVSLSRRLSAKGDILAAKTFLALQGRLHSVKALEALKRHPHDHGSLREYATNAYSSGFESIRSVLVLLPRNAPKRGKPDGIRFAEAFKGTEKSNAREMPSPGGLCAEQATQHQCHHLLQMWQMNHVDGAPCSWCVLPRKLGGPKGMCESSKHLVGLGTNGWVCTPESVNSQVKTGNTFSSDLKRPIEEMHEDRELGARGAEPNPSLMGADVEMAAQFTDDMASDIVSDVVRKVHLSTTQLLRTNINVSAIQDAGAAISVGVAQRTVPRMTHALAGVLSEAVTRMSAKKITQTLVPSLSHSLTSTMTQALSRSPRADYFCWYCGKYKVYCDACKAAYEKSCATDFRCSYYSEYFGRYYAFYYGSALADGFVDAAFENTGPPPGSG